MKVLLVALLFVLLPWIALAQAPSAPAVVKGAHYTVTSWAGAEAGKATLDVMEALVVRYNSLFQFDLTRLTTPWNVVLFANKEDFDVALKGQLAVVPSDYIYLQYANPKDSALVAWVPAPGTPPDEVRSLASQGFYQFLWTFVPHPPAWIETGLATVFWNSHWDGSTLTASADLPFLETLQDKWKDKNPDLVSLMSAPSGLEVAGERLDLEAWAWVSFLLENPDPSYSRVFGSTLANLSATATEEENRRASLARIQTAKNLSAAATDLRSWWRAKTGFSARIEQGRAEMKEKNYKAASAAFISALVLRPEDNTALYYAGLAAYEQKEYPSAEALFSRVQPKVLPPGLLPYARGLTAFAMKNSAAAKTWLTQAAEEDAATYSKLAAPVLELIK